MKSASPAHPRLSYAERDEFLTGYNYRCSMPAQAWPHRRAPMGTSSATRWRRG
ncbi:MAG: hypothetical protein ABN502_03570 [Gammaproteobacteria bacterium]